MKKRLKLLLVKCLDTGRRDIYAFRQIPLALAYLVPVAREFCDVDVHDMLVDDHLIERVAANPPDIIGFSIFSADYLAVQAIILQIKRAAPESLLIAGGAHATVEPVEVLRLGIDVVVRGEGELPFRELLRQIASGTKDFTDIPGISYFDELTPSGVMHNPVQQIQNLDDVSLPEIEAFEFTKYTQYPLLTSRGCPFSCKFCASKTIWGKCIRFHSADRVFKEIDRAVNQFGYKRLVFVDDTFTLNHKRLKQLCAMISDADLGIRWSVNSRVDSITDETAFFMARAGCDVVSFGIETGSPEIQQAINKHTTLRQMQRAVEACRNHGIRVKTGWMIGLPGSYEEQMKSLDVMLALQPDEITIHHFIPMPGTPYWNHPEQYGISFDKDRLLASFSLDALPRQIGLKFQYLSHEDIEWIIDTFIIRLQEAGYKRPGELSTYDKTSKVVNTYKDRGRLPVLPEDVQINPRED